MRNPSVIESEPFTYETETSWEKNRAYGAHEESEAVSPGKAWPDALEFESSYTTAAYVRWLQQALNQILGLRLTVDGVNGPQTRSAIRSFQQRQGLTVDGIVGPATAAALKKLRREMFMVMKKSMPRRPRKRRTFFPSNSVILLG